MTTKITTGKELAEAALNVAKNYKTLYIMGCFGAPMTEKNKERYTQNHSYNRAGIRTRMINAATADTFGFDCVCLIKGLLWGWNGDATKNYGGAVYGSNGVPDIGADTMISKCSGVSTDFSEIEVGEAVWMKGHIGVYIGDGLAVECTPKWKNCVQVTACNCSKSGYNRRNWTKHGKLPYITYVKQAENVPSDGAASTTNEEDDMDVKRFTELFGEMRKGLQDNDAGTWSAEARQWALDTGLIVGNGTTIDGSPNCMWADFMTREQMAMVLYRFAQMMNKT